VLQRSIFPTQVQSIVLDLFDVTKYPIILYFHHHFHLHCMDLEECFKIFRYFKIISYLTMEMILYPLDHLFLNELTHLKTFLFDQDPSYNLFNPPYNNTQKLFYIKAIRIRETATEDHPLFFI